MSACVWELHVKGSACIRTDQAPHWMRRSRSFLRVGIDYFFGVREYREQEASGIDCALAIVERDDYAAVQPIRVFNAGDSSVLHDGNRKLKENVNLPAKRPNREFKLGHRRKSHSENKVQFTHEFVVKLNPAANNVASSVFVLMTSIAPRMSKSFRTASAASSDVIR